MKRVIAIAIFCLTQAICASSHGNLDSYEVAQIYKAVEMDRGSKSIDNYGNIKEAKYFFYSRNIEPPAPPDL